MVRYRYYVDKDKEQDWLNDMADRGWALEHFFGGFYTFVSCRPGEYYYQIDMLDNWTGESDNYQEFMQDLNIELVAKWWRWVFLRKRKADGVFEELYTDADSKIASYKKMRNFYKIMNIIILLSLNYDIVCFIYFQEWLFMPMIALMGLLWVVTFKIAVRYNKTIVSIRNAEQPRKKKPVALMIGLLLYLVNLLIKNFYSGPAAAQVSLMLIFLAILFIVFGIVRINENT